MDDNLDVIIGVHYDYNYTCIFTRGQLGQGTPL